MRICTFHASFIAPVGRPHINQTLAQSSVVARQKVTTASFVATPRHPTPRISLRVAQSDACQVRVPFFWRATSLARIDSNRRGLLGSRFWVLSWSGGLVVQADGTPTADQLADQVDQPAHSMVVGLEHRGREPRRWESYARITPASHDAEQAPLFACSRRLFFISAQRPCFPWR